MSSDCSGAMPSEPNRARLEAFLRIAEREFTGKSFNEAIKMFSKALKIAQELKSVKDVIKILDILAVCKERTGNLNGAFSDAQQIIRTDPKSPIGYLRTAKVLIALKAPEDAYNIYQMGLKRADHKSPFFAELKKRFEELDKTIPKEVDPSAKGHLSSLPFNIFARVFGFMTEEYKNNLACTQKNMLKRCMHALLEQPAINLDKYKPKQFMALFANYKLLKSPKLLCCSSQANDFLSSLHKYIQKRPARRVFISKLQLDVSQHETQLLFIKTLPLGLKSSLKHLKLSFSSGLSEDVAVTLLKVIFSECELRSLSINDPNGIFHSANTSLTGKCCHSLRFLQLDGPINCNLFSRCINLLTLLIPFESRISKFESDRLAIVHARIAPSNDGIVPLPISHLKLSRATEQIRRIDFSQYSYLALQTIHLESVTFSAERPLFNPNWSQLQVLRLDRVHFYQPQSDLTAILSMTRCLRILEISQISLAHLSQFDAATAGLWLINLIFSAESLSSLEHLILSRIQLGPDAFTALIKGIKERKLKKLKVLGLVDVQAQGAQLSQFFKLLRHAYPNSQLLTHAEHENIYNQEFNLFTGIYFSDF